MAEPVHTAAMHHLPIFITSPGQTDGLFVGTAIFVFLAVVGIGVFYLKLHALPEQLAHRGQKVQFQIVAVLGLLALFTHNHTFWVAGLLLALVPLPDFTSPLLSIATSLERIAAQAGPAPAPSPTSVLENTPPAQLKSAPKGAESAQHSQGSSESAPREASPPQAAGSHHA